jgi:hypothetical protein
MDYAAEEQKAVVLRCNGCGCPCGGETEDAARAHAVESGWFAVPFGPSETKWYCPAHPKPESDTEPSGPGLRFARR